MGFGRLLCRYFAIVSNIKKNQINDCYYMNIIIYFTLLIAVKAGSHAFSRSWTRSWIQLEITLKNALNIKHKYIKDF